MLPDVDQQLAHDPEQGVAGGLVQRCDGTHMQVDDQAVMALHFVGQPFERRAQAGLVQHGRAQLG